MPDVARTKCAFDVCSPQPNVHVLIQGGAKNGANGPSYLYSVNSMTEFRGNW